MQACPFDWSLSVCAPEALKTTLTGLLGEDNVEGIDRLLPAQTDLKINLIQTNYLYYDFNVYSLESPYETHYFAYSPTVNYYYSTYPFKGDFIEQIETPPKTLFNKVGDNLFLKLFQYLANNQKQEMSKTTSYLNWNYSGYAKHKHKTIVFGIPFEINFQEPYYKNEGDRGQWKLDAPIGSERTIILKLDPVKSLSKVDEIKVLAEVEIMKILNKSTLAIIEPKVEEAKAPPKLKLNWAFKSPEIKNNTQSSLTLHATFEGVTLNVSEVLEKYYESTETGGIEKVRYVWYLRYLKPNSNQYETHSIATKELDWWSYNRGDDLNTTYEAILANAEDYFFQQIGYYVNYQITAMQKIKDALAKITAN